MLDGTRFPFVKALTGTWHKRPSDDKADLTSTSGPVYRTLCGLVVHSVHVSGYDPRLGSRTNRVCKSCLAAVPR